MNRPAAFLASFLLATCALSATDNLIPNGNFEKGGKHPDGWHVKLDDYTVKKESKDDGTATYRYVSGCGEELGAVRPWCGLRCPKCEGFMGGEESGDWYLDNDEYVLLAPGASGRALKFDIPKAVGENEGVRVYSGMIRVKPGWGYKLSLDAKTGGDAIARVFVECFQYRKLPDDFALDKKLDPTGKEKPLDRTFRAQINCGSPRSWEHFTKDIVAPKRYQFEFMAIKLYAYMPGEAYFDNVKLVPMTPKEMEQVLDEKDKKVKDKKFKYR